MELLLLRIVHIVGGIFWVGSTMFTAFFLMPTLVKAGPATAAPVMAGLQQRRLMVWMPVVAIVVILSGIRLMMIVSGGDPQWFGRPQGQVYSAAGAMAIVAFLIGVAVNRPAIVKAGRLGQAAASDETSRAAIRQEIARLQRRAAGAATIVTWLLILSAAGMGVARYL